MNPILSIVIANYNYGRFLEDAILSVLRQEVGEVVELIICDAASTDNSVDIIKKYANGLPPNASYLDCFASNPSSPIRNPLKHGGVLSQMADSRQHLIKGFRMREEGI